MCHSLGTSVCDNQPWELTQASEFLLGFHYIGMVDQIIGHSSPSQRFDTELISCGSKSQSSNNIVGISGMTSSRPEVNLGSSMSCLISITQVWLMGSPTKAFLSLGKFQRLRGSFPEIRHQDQTNTSLYNSFFYSPRYMQQ